MKWPGMVQVRIQLINFCSMVCIVVAGDRAGCSIPFILPINLSSYLIVYINLWNALFFYEKEVNYDF